MVALAGFDNVKVNVLVVPAVATVVMGTLITVCDVMPGANVNVPEIPV
jgi:hypothetical protein